MNHRKIEPSILRAIALKEIQGVGDATHGQWEEVPEWGIAYHIRRRLSAGEEAITGPAVDIRGTEDAVARAMVVIRQCPHIPAKYVLEEAREPPGECRVSP